MDHPLLTRVTVAARLWWHACICVIITAGVLASSGCEQPDSPSDGGIARDETSAAQATLRIGTSGDYAPFSLAGRGFDVEVATRFAEARGYRIEWVVFRWPELEADVRAGRFDIAMSGITWRPERAVVGYMTRAVAVGGPCLVGTVEGRRVAVNRGGALERFARRELADRELRATERNLELPQLLARGEVDAILTDSFELSSFQAELEAARPQGATAPASAVRCWPERARKVYWVAPARVEDLAVELDAWLLASESELARLRVRWFGAESSRDELDHLIDLMARRLELMPAVGAWKRARGLPLEDLEREAVVLERVAERARSLGLPVAQVRELFADQIQWAKEVQGRTDDAATLDLVEELRPLLLRLGDRTLESIARVRSAGVTSPEPTDRQLEPLRPWLLPYELQDLRNRLRGL